MSVEDIIRAWKADDDDEKDEKAPENPAGEQELSDAELEQVVGGEGSAGGQNSCDYGCWND